MLKLKIPAIKEIKNKSCILFFSYICVITEEFLHYIWQYRLYSPDLVLQTGEQIVVLHPGVHNTDSGLDFFNAKIRIGETAWAGNIEIHIFRPTGNIITINNRIAFPIDNVNGYTLTQLENALYGNYAQSSWRNAIQNNDVDTTEGNLTELFSKYK